MDKKNIHYLRRASQVFFFVIFVILATGTVCSVVLPWGTFFICPLGAFLLVLSSGTILVGVIVSALVLIVATIIIGNAFCSWVCPIGLITDVTDTFIDKSKITPLFKRFRIKVVELIGNRTSTYGILASTLLGAAILKYPIFCILCPIGTICRGVVQGSAISAGLEFALVPGTVGLSLGEKRFWCKYLCPVCSLLSIFGRLNLFIKPAVNEMECKDWEIVRRICPGWEKNESVEKNDEIPSACMTCDSCGKCDICKEACPEDINFGNTPNVNSYCTKCLECYVECPRGAVHLNLRASKDKEKKVS